MKHFKKIFYTLALICALLTQNISVFAAEISNDYIEYPTAYTSVEAHELTSGKSTRATNSVTHHLSVTPSYGIISGCSLSGAYWCTTSSGDMTSASYTSETTYYHSDGTRIITPEQSGSSTSSKKYTWTDSVSAMVGGPATTSTTTTGTCVKSGYKTVTISKSTSC